MRRRGVTHVSAAAVDRVAQQSKHSRLAVYDSDESQTRRAGRSAATGSRKSRRNLEIALNWEGWEMSAVFRRLPLTESPYERITSPVTAHSGKRALPPTLTAARQASGRDNAETTDRHRSKHISISDYQPVPRCGCHGFQGLTMVL
jgi:hypothetical protein